MRTRSLGVLAVLGLLWGAQVAAAQRGETPNPLATVKHLKCEFPVAVNGNWVMGQPEGQVRKTGLLTFEFVDIDTAESSANVVGLSTPSHIVAQLSGWNLHFLDIRPTGSLTITTVFAQESRDKKLKAVHTRTDYLPVSIPGFESKPDAFQYYGECEIVPE